MGDTKYSIIREQGEFMDPVPLTDRENVIVNNSDNDDEDEE